MSEELPEHLYVVRNATHYTEAFIAHKNTWGSIYGTPVKYYNAAIVAKLEAEIETLNAQLSTEVEVISCGNCADLEAESLNLRQCLHELADLMDDVRTGDYKPDSFTTQPARAALAAREPGEGEK